MKEKQDAGQSRGQMLNVLTKQLLLKGMQHNL